MRRTSVKSTFTGVTSTTRSSAECRRQTSSSRPPCQGFSNLGSKDVDDPRNKLWKSYLQLAEIQHAENLRAETLRNQHAAWCEARQLREFLEAMTTTVDAMDPGDQRDTATEWLVWCRRYVDDAIDPLKRRLAMPTIRPPTWEERHPLENDFVHKLERA